MTPTDIPKLIADLRNYELTLDENVVICDRRVVDMAADIMRAMAIWEAAYSAAMLAGIDDEAGAAVIADTLAERDAEIARLREVLEHIGIYGCGMLNQPAAMNGPEEVWLKQRIFEMERTARAALRSAKV